MRIHRHRPVRKALLCATVIAAAVSWFLSGCSQGGQSGRANSPSARSSAASSTVPPGAIGISAGGVTTRVDVPAESTEEEYFQACHAAKTWMDTQGSAGEALIEPYLRMIQASASGAAGSWNNRWADLSPPRQAAVIVAAQAAGRGECG